MIVNIQISENKTAISFKQSDFTCLSDIQNIVSAVASGRHSVELYEVLSADFENFISSMEPDNCYGILIETEGSELYITYGLAVPMPIDHQ